MNPFILAPILFPMLAGLLLPMLSLSGDRSKRQIYVASSVIVTVLLVFAVINAPNNAASKTAAATANAVTRKIFFFMSKSLCNITKNNSVS